MFLSAQQAQRNGNFYNRSVLFEGTNDTVDCGEPANLSVNLASNEITIDAWIRPTSLAAVMDIIGKAAPFAPTFGPLIGVTAAGAIFCYAGNVSKTTEGTPGLVTINTWFHVTFTVRNIAGTYTANVWVNATKQGSDITAPGSDDTTGIPFRIGSSYVLDNPNTARPFVGQICQVTVWNVGFTQAEIQELQQGNKPMAPRQHSRAANLIHYWPMGTGDTFPTIRDVVLSSPANGTCQGMVSGANNFVTTVP